MNLSQIKVILFILVQHHASFCFYVCLYCSLVTSKGVPYGMSKDRVTLYDSTVVQLSLDQLDKVCNQLSFPEDVMFIQLH